LLLGGGGGKGPAGRGPGGDGGGDGPGGGRQGADRQAAAEVGLPPSDGLPRGADADRDRVDRRGNEAGSSENGNEACRADVAGDYGKGNGAPAAKGVRRIHRRRDRREGQAVEARAARGAP